MKIFIDSEYKCRTENDGTMVEIETDYFNGKCIAYIEGYRFLPLGETWTREDGVEFIGEMITPWKDSTILNAYQQQYEAMLAELEDADNALEILGVTVNE